MTYTTLDKIIKGYLLQRRYPIHFYVDFLIYAQRCFEELHMDVIGNIRTLKLAIDTDTYSVALPTDFMDWIKVGVPNGQFVIPLIQRKGIARLSNYENDRLIATFGTVDSGESYTDGSYSDVPLTGGTGSGATADIDISTASSVQTITVTLAEPGTRYTAGDVLSASASDMGGTGSGFSVPVATVTSTSRTTFGDLNAADFWYGYDINYNDRMEYTGRNYGAAPNRSDSFNLIRERNEIQLHQNIQATDIILEYISDGSEVDNATQVTPYAKSTFEAYINWKLKENGRSYGEGERMRAQRQYEHQHTILRGRMNDMTVHDFKASIYRHSIGAPK